MVNKDGRDAFSSTDFSLKDDGKKQDQHAFAVYIANKGAMDLFLKKIFE